MYILVVDGVPVGLYYSLDHAERDAQFLTSDEQPVCYGGTSRSLKRETLDRWSYNSARCQGKYYIYRLTEREDETQS
jgi:hypothetical protein